VANPILLGSETEVAWPVDDLSDTLSRDTADVTNCLIRHPKFVREPKRLASVHASGQVFLHRRQNFTVVAHFGLPLFAVPADRCSFLFLASELRWKYPPMPSIVPPEHRVTAFPDCIANVAKRVASRPSFGNQGI
jgi:hypothetical protein